MMNPEFRNPANNYEHEISVGRLTEPEQHLAQLLADAGAVYINQDVATRLTDWNANQHNRWRLFGGSLGRHGQNEEYLQRRIANMSPTSPESQEKSNLLATTIVHLIHSGGFNNILPAGWRMDAVQGSLFDDVCRGTDIVIQFSHRDGEVLLLSVDVTTSENEFYRKRNELGTRLMREKRINQLEYHTNPVTQRCLRNQPAVQTILGYKGSEWMRIVSEVMARGIDVLSENMDFRVAIIKEMITQCQSEMRLLQNKGVDINSTAPEFLDLLNLLDRIIKKAETVVPANNANQIQLGAPLSVMAH